METSFNLNVKSVLDSLDKRFKSTESSIKSHLVDSYDNMFYYITQHVIDVKKCLENKALSLDDKKTDTQYLVNNKDYNSEEGNLMMQVTNVLIN